MISIVCCFLLFSVVFAFDMNIYRGVDYYLSRNNSEPVLKVNNNTIYDFEYHLDEILKMDIILKKKAPNVTAAVYVTNTNSSETIGNTENHNMTQSKKEVDCLLVHLGDTKLKSQFIDIGMQVYRGTAVCATYIISKGSATLSNMTTEHNLCTINSGNCVLVIYLQNECSEGAAVKPATQEKDNTGLLASSPSTLTYRISIAISSVVVLCGSIFIIYLCVKKFRNRSSGPEDTLELKTYATRNEVLYADLSFVQGNNQPPRPEEESPYAQIVGVMRPQK